MDFTHAVYARLLQTLLERGYSFLTFSAYAKEVEKSVPVVLLRHDVDRLPSRSVKLAELEAEYGVRSTYFFRVKPCSFSKGAISRVISLGHEVGYHYESLSDAKGDMEAGWNLFIEGVRRFHEFGGISSIAMHGRPFSPWDNRDLWRQYDYRTLGILIEAYLDLDWNRFLYFSDTGRSWSMDDNIRDFPEGVKPPKGIASTHDLIAFLDRQPLDVVISTHPERWSRSFAGWIQVLATDKAINIAKLILRKARNADLK